MDLVLLKVTWTVLYNALHPDVSFCSNNKQYIQNPEGNQGNSMNLKTGLFLMKSCHSGDAWFPQQ